MIRRFVATNLLLLLAAVGCHRYRPAEPDAVSRGAQVRVRLTDEGQESLARRTVRFERELEGRLHRVGPDSLWIVSSRGNRRAVTSTAATIRDTLAIPRGHVNGLDREEVSVLRTAGIIGAGAAGIGIFAATSVTDPGGSDAPREPGDSGEATISIPLSIP